MSKTFSTPGELLSRLRRDTGFAVRSLMRSKGFAVVAICTLALGIGANTALFSVVRGVLLKDLPYEDPERLVFLWVNLKRGEGRYFFSGPDFVELRQQNESFEDLAAFKVHQSNPLTGSGRPVQVDVAYTTPNYFSVLGIEPAMGRDFTPGDDRHIPIEMWNDPDAELPMGAVVISHDLWRSHFGADPGVVGQSFRLNGQPHEIIGVAPPEARLFLPAELGELPRMQAWGMGRFDIAPLPRDMFWLKVIGRLKPGVTLEQAQAEADLFARRQRELHSDHAEKGFEIEVRSLHGEVIKKAKSPILILLGASGFLLMIACANVSNLLLARSVERSREMALRQALGAGRGRLVSQLLTEGVVMALAGAALGLALAYGCVRILLVLQPGNLPRLEAVGLDAHVLAFTVLASLLSTLVFAVVPALQASRPDLVTELREGGRSSGGKGRHNLRMFLVAAEVALSLVLVIGAALLLRSAQKLGEVDPGFEADKVLTARLYLPNKTYPWVPDPQKRLDFIRRTAEGAANLPGVESAAVSTEVPMDGRDTQQTYATEESAAIEGGERPAHYRPVTPGFFQTLGVRLLAGRPIAWDDVESERPVAVVDEVLAERAWPGRNPVGQRLRVEHWSTDGDSLNLVSLWTEVIGVVEKVRSQSLQKEDVETLYLPYNLYGDNQLTVAVRAKGDPMQSIEALRGVVEELDKDIPLFDVRMLDDYIAESLSAQRFSTMLISLLGGLGLLLALVGIYGMISYSVSQRNREMGIRIALGARRTGILGLVLTQGLVLTLVGLVVGLAGAVGLTRLLTAQLFGVTATDPVIFAGVSALLLGVALVASYVPASRAAGVDPVSALRSD